MDHHGANLLAVGILAALIHREGTGQGQWIDMATTEAGIGLLGPSLLDSSINCGMENRPETSNRASAAPMAPHGVYGTEAYDRWVAIACRDDREWAALAEAIAEPWAQDTSMVSVTDRLADQDRLDSQLDGWTRSRTGEEIVALLTAKTVPCAIVTSPASGSTKAISPSPGHCGPTSTTLDESRSASTGCRSIYPKPIGASGAARRSSVSITTWCSASCSASRLASGPV